MLANAMEQISVCEGEDLITQGVVTFLYFLSFYCCISLFILLHLFIRNFTHIHCYRKIKFSISNMLFKLKYY